MNSKTIKQILGIIGIIFLIYLLCFLIITFKAISQLRAVKGSEGFPVTTLFNIKENRITDHSTIYNKDEAIEYYCCIDSLYLVHVVRIGKIDDVIFPDKINFSSKEDFPFGKQSFFNSTIPPALSPIYLDFLSSYDVRLLPLTDIEKIDLYINGEMLKNDTITYHILSYSIKATSISYSFNDSNKEDMNSMSKYNPDPPVSKLIFYRTSDAMLYIINISQNDKSEPDITNILRF